MCRKQQLLLVLDSCFSGIWCEEAKTKQNVSVYASCACDEFATGYNEGGAFTLSLAQKHFAPTICSEIACWCTVLYLVLGFISMFQRALHTAGSWPLYVLCSWATEFFLLQQFYPKPSRFRIGCLLCGFVGLTFLPNNIVLYPAVPILGGLIFYGVMELWTRVLRKILLWRITEAPNCLTAKQTPQKYECRPVGLTYRSLLTGGLMGWADLAYVLVFMLVSEAMKPYVARISNPQ